LVRKAGKLSAADLKRIATVKRCGLFVPEASEDSALASTSSAASSASSASSPGLPARRVNDKLFAVVGQVHGAADLLAAMQTHLPACGVIGARSPRTSLARLSSKGSMTSLPRGSRLLPGVASASSAATRVTSATSAPEALVTGSDVEVHHMDEEGENL